LKRLDKAIEMLKKGVRTPMAPSRAKQREGA
jgi:hypothetical protein